MPTTRRSYAPPTILQQWTGADDVRPRDPLPFLPPPPPSGPLPPLPSPPREPTFANASAYTLSTHIVPAAHPRYAPHVAPPTLPADLDALDKRSRKAALDRVTAELLKYRYAYEADEPVGEPGKHALWIAVSRYVPKEQPKQGGLTLVFTHPIGFCKEIWEPTIDTILSQLASSPNSPPIDEIWALDALQHGDSALLNAGRLSALFDWRDNGRDLSHFLLHYLPDAPAGSALPTHLPRLSDAAAASRSAEGFAARTLVGVGHSLGGVGMALSALDYPTLYSSLVLVDPPIAPPYGPPLPEAVKYLYPATRLTIGRQARWPDWASAETYFATNPAFASWAPAARAAYLAGALHPAGDGAVALKAPALHEALHYEIRGATEAWARWPSLPARIALRWIMPVVESTFGMKRSVARELVWRRPENARNVLVESGHLIPVEKPEELGAEIAGFLKETYAGAEGRKARL